MNAGRPNAIVDLALADCASEPIRTPGAIQPHGWLLAFDLETQSIQHLSANVPALFGQDVENMLGRRLVDCVGAEDASALGLALAPRGDDDTDAPLQLQLHGAKFDGTLHRHPALAVLELERCAPPAEGSGHVLARALRRLQNAPDLARLFDVTVREVRELTGCDRVVIYAFGADGHGSVLAEARSDAVPSYLGLHFPASDIPAQARELYRQNWLRMIPDVDYEPVPVIGLQGPSARSPLDLSFSILRSVSPVHREYMRNMGSASSLSVSLLKDGELWGLVSCVHGAPRHVSREVRAACLSIGRLLSLQISAMEGLRDARLVRDTEPLTSLLRGHMEASTAEVFESLAAQSETLLRLAEADGAAILVGPHIERFGEAPSEAEIAALAPWAAAQASASGCFATDRLPLLYGPAATFADRASGLLVIVLPKPVLSMILWFRPEASRTVSWAGNPDKAATLDPADPLRRLTPRNSFDAWKTLLEHHSLEWAAHQLHAAKDLRRCAIELDLARQVVKEQLAVAARDELVAVVSHDLRSPLQVVALQTLALTRTLINDDSAPARRMLASAQSIQRATLRMTDMLRDLLDLSTIEQGRYEVDLLPRSVDLLFGDASALLTVIADTKHIELAFESEPGLIMHADIERIYQVIANLVGNAIKFTGENGTVSVKASAMPDAPGQVLFTVQDSGCGMTAEQMEHIFERYWRIRDANPKGTGLGLYIARGIVEAHGGRIWAGSEPDVGSLFSFTLPRAGSPEADPISA